MPQHPLPQTNKTPYIPDYVSSINLIIATPRNCWSVTRGFDAQWLKAAGLESDAFIEVVRHAITDGQVADWVRSHVHKPAEQAAFNHWLLHYGSEEDPELRARLALRKEQSGLAHRTDITTFVDYIDADEGRSPLV
jgi:hypothetical protein